MDIRKATPADKEQIFYLVKDFATSYITEQHLFEKVFDELFHNPTAYIFVAADECNIVGYCLGFVHNAFYANGNVAWLEEIMVSEEHRKKGIGKKLMQAFESAAKQAEAKLVALATRRAAAFYKVIGYQPSAEYYRKLL
ncbi:GNAT family N-acetyltransferase [Paenibacillus sp. 79R4]|uniref:GNAT family N-acetyltransferase n=1 Tax=Paenibacillus sp. 79R4 TaxID=2212847 RepID=UPI001C4D1C3A